MTDHQPYRIKFRRDLDALTGSPEVTDALLDHANAAAGERIERVVIDEHQQGVVLAGWLLTFPEVLAAVLPDLLADAWDEGRNTAADAAERCTVTDGYGPCGECATCDPPNPYHPTTTKGA